MFFVYITCRIEIKFFHFRPGLRFSKTTLSEVTLLTKCPARGDEEVFVFVGIRNAI